MCSKVSVVSDNYRNYASGAERAAKVDIEGDRPMSLHWKLEVALPMELFRRRSVLRA